VPRDPRVRPRAGWYIPPRTSDSWSGWLDSQAQTGPRAPPITVRLRPSRKDPGAAVAPIAYTPGRDGPGNEARRGSRRRRRRPENPSHAAALRSACRADAFLSVCQEPGFFLLGRCSLLHFEISRVGSSPALLSTQQHAAAVPVKQAAKGPARPAKSQYLLCYCNLKQACPLSRVRACLLGRRAIPDLTSSVSGIIGCRASA
jgi:hypothetical protein